MTKISSVTLRNFDYMITINLLNAKLVTFTCFTLPFTLRCSCNLWQLSRTPELSWVSKDNKKFPKTLLLEKMKPVQTDITKHPVNTVATFSGMALTSLLICAHHLAKSTRRVSQ